MNRNSYCASVVALMKFSIVREEISKMEESVSKLEVVRSIGKKSIDAFGNALMGVGAFYAELDLGEMISEGIHSRGPRVKKSLLFIASGVACKAVSELI